MAKIKNQPFTYLLHSILFIVLCAIPLILNSFPNKKTEEKDYDLVSYSLLLQASQTGDVAEWNLQKRDTSNHKPVPILLKGAHFAYFKLQSIDLSFAQLQGANFYYANLTSSSLTQSDLQGANFYKAQLKSSDISYSNLNSAVFMNADLSNTNLSYAQLQCANLLGADLRGANLSYADLRSADLRHARLEGANLEHANMQGVIDRDYIDRNIIRFRKPAIYLYPEQATEITVKLDYKGVLEYTYPAYNDGWTVTAQPNGTLTYHADGREYSYLFWEGKSNIDFDFSKGFVVKGSDTVPFLQKTLAQLGLTPREYNEFIVYWMPHMQNNPYNLIAFQGSSYTDSAPLRIQPQPDSVLRVFMAFKPLQNAIEVPPQNLKPFERKGFAVIEWGGTECR